MFLSYTTVYMSYVCVYNPWRVRLRPLAVSGGHASLITPKYYRYSNLKLASPIPIPALISWPLSLYAACSYPCPSRHSQVHPPRRVVAWDLGIR